MWIFIHMYSHKYFVFFKIRAMRTKMNLDSDTGLVTQYSASQPDVSYGSTWKCRVSKVLGGEKRELRWCAIIWWLSTRTSRGVTNSWACKVLHCIKITKMSEDLYWCKYKVTVRFPKLSVTDKVVTSLTSGFGWWRWKGWDCPLGQMQARLAQLACETSASVLLDLSWIIWAFKA